MPNKQIKELSPLALVIDDDQDYLHLAKSILGELGYLVVETNSINEAREDINYWLNELNQISEEKLNLKEYSFGLSLIVMDNRYGSGSSYWAELIHPLRQKHPQAIILLVSGLSDEELNNDIKNLEQNANAATKKLLEHDPYITYLPKGEGYSYGTHRRYLRDFSQKLITKIRNRRQLQALLLECAYQSAYEVLHTKLGELVNSVSVRSGKEDTKKMDVIAEQFIHKMFAQHIHSKSLVICTEELGVYNQLHRRVSNPEFYIFSDPLDGSSAFEKLVKNFIEQKLGEKKLIEIIPKSSDSSEYASQWKCGCIDLNSPMISMVLTERHRVVSAVMINLFTWDIYISLDFGNYWKANVDFACPESKLEPLLIETIIKGRNISDLPELSQWKELKFKKSVPLKKNPENSESESENSNLFLCPLKQDPLPQSRWKFFETYIKPLLPTFLSVDESLKYRTAQQNFTPGPGRILFLMYFDRVDTYETSSLDGQSYRCVLSLGEKITEWIGWFAFLRHTPNLSAYCLREYDDKLASDNSSPFDRKYLPQKLLSIFRDGYIDIGILHTAYAEEMTSYSDTVLIAFNEDENWYNKYISIPLYQKIAPSKN